ncbi:FIG01043295: hypothetical protein [Alloactinosynnema sp. L-07]|uniref:RHS repeat-associated core domain-containing protein n=1 Tax=Alloactinosynnema sp. L-07 TaxID=1653480 RepID=UPI00065F0A38|nr:RHS repeat-associated core domain-containing protein [Alloactinosynnema sp. L-07]CRK56760.1 FIG01043295: hypothetical protein [Alloactinosynnema sp. L-07]
MSFRTGTRWRPLALPAVLALALAAVQPAIAEPKAAPWAAPAAPQVTGVPAPDSVARVTRPAWTADGKVVRGARPVTWPAGEAAVELATVPTEGGRGGRSSGRVRAGDLPVVLSSAASAKMRVAVHDRATAARLGVDGLVLSVGRADGGSGPVTVGVDTRGFAAAFGGDWGSRLRLVALPSCALTSPDRADCRTARPVPGGTVDPGGTVSGTVPLGADRAVLAVEAGPSGDNGDYTATPLTQSGTWNVGPQTGDFSWSTALRTPPSNGGPAPALSVAYSSGSVDGRTSTSNNQGGWVGDGWSLWSGFIERKYTSCAEDNPSHKTGDQCWRGANATLSMNGHAGELIDSGTPNVWRLKRDDGTRVERLTDTTRGNGDDDGEYWKVTTTDGSQHFFGAHKQPNWSDGKPVTDSVWTVPVYGNNAGEPCHQATFAASWCRQAWRWNLDYVVDPHGNTMTFFYGKETGAYGRDNTPSQRTDYTRGGWVDRIEYGTRQGSEVSSVAPAVVRFQTAERCLSGCWSGTPWTSAAVTAAWPDTPWDQHCAAAPCTGKTAPTFWSARRLTAVTTQVRTAAGGYRDVESWSLRHEFLNAGDNEGSPLWLRGLTKTGHVGTAVSDPEIVFNPGAEPLPNRVDGPADGRTSLTRFRIKAITNESGGQVTVAYSGPDCTRATLPDPATNTRRCMPQYYSPSGTPTLDWFHKYVVTSVTLHDTTADGTNAPSNPDQTTSYDYLDAPAWHHTDDELTKTEHRTWGDWRGYGRVLTRTGATGAQTAVETRYLRGMDGDKQAGGTRDVWVADTWGGTVEDHESLNGFTRQTITFNGPGGAEVSSTVNDPWRAGPTATRTRDGVTTTAWRTGVGVAKTRTPLAAGGFRTSGSTTVRDEHAFPVTVTDHGDLANAGDETCTRTAYARDETRGMLDKVASVETLAGTCDAASTPPMPSTVLARTRNHYDDAATVGVPPTKGDLTKVEELDRWSGSTPTYVTATTSAYDANGRVVETRDGLNRAKKTAYTTDTATGLVTAKTETNALGHVTVTSYEPAWRSPVKVTDPNGAVAELTYDGLGRLTAVWKPGRSRSLSPSLRFAYLSRSSGGPSAITTETLLPTGTGYRASVSLLDGFLRPRQTQEQATGGGRAVTDTLHDAAGRVERKTAPYYDSTNSPVSANLAAPAGEVPSVTRTEYDGAGRVTAAILLGAGAAKWRTTTVHNGERVSTVPPKGGTATTVISDVDGNTTALRQYTAAASVGGDDPGTYDETRYSYTLTGKLGSVTDPASNTWTYGYDLRGRQISAGDPDKGPTTSAFDAAGQLVATTAPYGTTTSRLAYTYDALGRKTSVRENSDTGPVRSAWTYDATPIGSGPQLAKGRPSSSTRYAGTAAYTTRVDSYDPAGRATSNSVVLPPEESDLCAAPAPNPCAYTTPVTYRANGDVATTTMPAAADLPAEKLTLGYTDVGSPGTLLSPAQIYVYSVGYDKLGHLTQRQFGAYGSRLVQSFAFDEQTSRLAGVTAVPEARDEVLDLAYTYDDTGNLESVADTSGAQAADRQCFQFDHLRRLTEAWTPAAACAADRSVATLGGPAPYWHSWTFDVTGNRKSETRHATTDTVVGYQYPDPGQPRPHAVTRVTATGGQVWDRTYRYDNAGNLTERPTGTATQTLSWDVEGHLASTGGATRTVYDTDGTRLVRVDADGAKTLYLPGGTEIRAKGGVRSAKRHYVHAGTTVALRTGAGVQWLLSDHHGTAQVAVDATTLAATRSRTTPYGEDRATAAGWPTALDRGFVGGTKDPTGLTHIGAREYDPALGRFISVDPVIDPKDPQQLNAYAYAGNNPVSFSDPDGLRAVDDFGGSGSAQPSIKPYHPVLRPARGVHWFSRLNQFGQGTSSVISAWNYAADGAGGLGYALSAHSYMLSGATPKGLINRMSWGITRALSTVEDLRVPDATGKLYNPMKSAGGSLMNATRGTGWKEVARGLGSSAREGALKRFGLVGNIADAGFGFVEDIHDGADPLEAGVKAAFKLGGSIAGAAAGASVGTALCGGVPICGVIGGAIGGKLGGDLGGFIGEKAAPVISNGLKAAGRTLCFWC